MSVDKKIFERFLAIPQTLTSFLNIHKLLLIWNEKFPFSQTLPSLFFISLASTKPLLGCFSGATTDGLLKSFPALVISNAWISIGNRYKKMGPEHNKNGTWFEIPKSFTNFFFSGEIEGIILHKQLLVEKFSPAKRGFLLLYFNGVLESNVINK